nr:PREDICTED: uncharacterized protein C05D11.1-like [Bemisia tabaci]
MAPTDQTGQNSHSNSFEHLFSSKANDSIAVHKYRSSKTGLTVVIADVDGPVVNGYFCLATEAFDDDGLPHTLEHLIFLGSEEYPYKGVLDLLANRCLASGTNAWTDTDHTCYTMTTAGSEGFLSLMPVYLDHILYPTLTDSGFLTEVHHVTGEGRDAGVVYCEMQGRENTGESLVYLKLMRELYPGKCGYKSETGGIMKNLRESCNNTKVRDFHKKFYRAENLRLIITGQVSAQQVFDALAPIEQKILLKAHQTPQAPFKRPWQDPVPPLTESTENLVLYPCDDEENGMVYVGWRGPSASTDIYKLTCCSVLLKYLTDTAVSPLSQHFVEIDDSYCSNVCYSIVENSESAFLLQFENVPVPKLDAVYPKLKSVLHDISHGVEKIDMKRFHSVIHRHKLECLSFLETNPHPAVAFIVINDMLYGNTKEDLDLRLNQISQLDKMKNEPLEFWESLLKKYFVDALHVLVKGKPSTAELKRMMTEEKERISKQRTQIGDEGLKQKERELEAAMAQNEIPPPNDMLVKVPIPSTDSIKYHSIHSYSADPDSPQHPLFNASKAPIYMNVDDLRTNFVYMAILMDSSSLPQELRSYLLILTECLLESPINRDGNMISYEDVVTQLESDTVQTEINVGLERMPRFTCGPYSETLRLFVQLEPEKFEKGVNWIREILYQTVFTAERIKIIATKIINDVFAIKRCGNSMVRNLMKGLFFKKSSNHYAFSVLQQHKFLTKLLERLSADPEKVISEFNAVREVITTPCNMAIHLSANIGNLCELHPDAVSTLARLLPDTQTPVKNPLHVTPDWKLLSSEEERPVSGCVVGMGSVESNFFLQSTPAIKEFDHPDLPVLLVFLQYLTQLEGPLWRQIRGAGFAYTYSMIPRPNESLLNLIFFKASNVVAAYKTTKKIIEELCQSQQWDSTLFESAKSSLIFEIIEREKNIGDVILQSLLRNFKKVAMDYNQKLVESIQKVTIEDVKKVGPKYVLALFNSPLTRTALVCNPSKVEETAAALKELGCNLTTFSSLEDSFIN